MFAVYKPLEPGYAFDGTRHVGRFVWHELLTSDMDAAFDFYRQMFQWEETSAFDMGSDVGLYRMFGQKSGEYGGMFKGSGRMAGMQPFWTCYVHVKDVEKAAALATKRGGQVVNGPMEVPGGDVIAVIMDPQGAAFAVHQNPKAAAAAPAATTKRSPKKKAGRKAAKKAAGRKRTVTRTAKKARKAAKRSARAVKKAVKRGAAKVKRRVVKAKVKQRIAKTKRTARRRPAKRRR
jgi:predicted enzyme related to lactoylglutathione lyase